MSRLYMTSFLVLATMIISSCPVKADKALQVIESNVEKYKAGDQLYKDEVPNYMSLPLGGVVRLWDPNSNSTRVIERQEPDVEEGGTRDLLPDK
jgi:hypothetical protein